MKKRTNKQHSIPVNQTFNNSTQLIERIEAFKSKLNMKSNAEVLEYFIPKTDEDFFEHEWNKFTKSIIRCIPENDPRIDLINWMGLIYLRGVRSGKKITNNFIDDFKNEFGGGIDD